MTLFEDSEPEMSGGDLQTVQGLVRLQQLPGIGPTLAVRLARRFGEWDRLQTSSEEDVVAIIGVAGVRAHRAIGDVARTPSIPDGMLALCCFDDDWPTWLTNIPRPPAVIFYRGTLPDLGSVAVVGTRQPTRFGISVVKQLVERARTHGSGIVSGLALGVDSAAHEAALENGSKTWAILGGGVDVPSPRQNLGLATHIIDAGGGLISEQLPGSEPTPQRLVSRNRLQSAASRAVIVAQCGIPSGTLHTARFAIEQNRLLVVPRPRSPWDTELESAGNMALTNPDGCNPKILHATGALARRIASRRPVADLVLEDAANIESLWQ